MTIETHTLLQHNQGKGSVILSAGYGPPTKQELLIHYPGRFTWPQLKAIINSGDLDLLQRDKKLQLRYNNWTADLEKEYGSTVNYLLNHRLQWGKRDTLSLIPSALDEPEDVYDHRNTHIENRSHIAPEYFQADIPLHSELICIVRNDWPYSIPSEIEHTLIWSRVPIFHPALIHSSIDARIQQDGLSGFTGAITSAEQLPSLESCLPLLAEWGITRENIRTPRGSNEDEEMIRNAGKEVDAFVKRRWQENKWETAWFVNPPRLQSVPGLAHIHVFVRMKSPEEIAS
ncbi:hypothetical protein V8B97DRAFT_2034528 [Scleroderma yunnanense]